MNSLKFAFAVFAATLSVSAIARSSVPIINFDNVSIATISGKSLHEEQVRRAILMAANLKNWAISVQSDGKLLATLNVRGKHTIAVQITYAADKYSIGYINSINMNYDTRDGQPVIHPNYNRWVNELIHSIRGTLIGL